MVDAVDVAILYRDVSTYNSVFSHDASDRMRTLGMGELPPPAQCFICGSATCEAGYLNLGVWAEYIGNLLLCVPCTIQAAEKVDCVAPQVRVLFEKHISELIAHSQTLEQELEHANNQLNAYRTIIGATGLPDQAVSAIEREFVTSDAELNSSSDESIADTDEPVIDEGRTNVQSNSVSNRLIEL